MHVNFEITPDFPCICGSGKPFIGCHLQNGNIIAPPSTLVPSGLKTGNSKRKCILHATNNCDRKLSGEHIISASVLRCLSNKTIVLTGNGIRRSANIQSSSLTTKILCKRHNAAFSPLDQEAGRLYRAIRDFHILSQRIHPNRARMQIFSGNDIERWLLKTLFAQFYAKTTNITRHTHFIDQSLAELFYKNKWPNRTGLYVKVHNAHKPEPLDYMYRHSTELGLITSGAQVVAFHVDILGIQFLLVVGGNHTELERYTKEYTYRPSWILFQSADDIAAIGLAWHDHRGAIVFIPDPDLDVHRPNHVIKLSDYIKR